MFQSPIRSTSIPFVFAAPYPPRITGCDDCSDGNYKPYDCLEREPAEGILFVGDRLDKDINPALNAGMQAVLKAAYTNVGRKVPKGICKINRISELPSLIEKINAEISDCV